MRVLKALWWSSGGADVVLAAMADESEATRRADEIRVAEGEGWSEAGAVWAEFTDEELVGAMYIKERRDVVIPIEMSRRLIRSNQLLREAIEAFRISSEKASKHLICLTWVLVLLTATITGLTVKLLVGGGD